jgi:5'-3' exonuclease
MFFMSYLLLLLRAGSDNYRGLGGLGPQAAKGLGRQAGRQTGEWVEKKKEVKKGKNNEGRKKDKLFDLSACAAGRKKGRPLPRHS